MNEVGRDYGKVAKHFMRYKKLVKTIHNIFVTCFYHIKFWVHQENIFKV